MDVVTLAKVIGYEDNLFFLSLLYYFIRDLPIHLWED